MSLSIYVVLSFILVICLFLAVVCALAVIAGVKELKTDRLNRYDSGDTQIKCVFCTVLFLGFVMVNVLIIIAFITGGKG